jgi:two-component system, NtrC family, response regulator PilR
VQVKLLRAVQERSIRRLGEGKDRQVDVRLLAATNRNIEQEVKVGRFREDLFFRINVIRIHLPALRERAEDIPDLVQSFMEKLAAQEGRQAPVILKEALDALMTFDFPGNVRELQNMVEQAVALGEGRSIIGPELFDKQAHADKRNLEGMPMELPQEGMNLDELLSSIERRALEQALQRTAGVKTEAAKLLGISFRSMRYRLIKHKME